MAQAPLKKKPNFKKTFGSSHTSRKNRPEKSSSSSSSQKGGARPNSKLSRMLRDKKKVVGISKIEESLSGIAKSHMEELDIVTPGSKKRPEKGGGRGGPEGSSSASTLIPSMLLTPSTSGKAFKK